MLEQIGPPAPDRQLFNIVTLKNANGMQISVMDWGATWFSCKIALTNGELQEVLLGCATPGQYLNQKAYIGATIGRYANRIKDAEIRRGRRSYQLQPNQGRHQLHGGPVGFSGRRWNLIDHSEQRAVFSIYSPDGDQGYPGNMKTSVTYTLNDNNQVDIHYYATVDDECPINLTNHAFFNLEDPGADARQQKLMINADYFLPVNAEGIPVIGLKPVMAAPGMDFRNNKILFKDFLKDNDQRLTGGYDHAYLLHTACGQCREPAAALVSSDSRRRLTIYTTEPAIQLYTGNFLAGTPARGGGAYGNYAGVALEPQVLPDSPNHPEWPQKNCWIKPGEVYESRTIYHFSVI